MCDPVTLGIASFAIGATQSIVQYSAASQEAAAVRENAAQAYTYDQQQLSLRQMQEDDAAQQQAYAQRLAEAETKSEINVMEASSGVTGISFDNLRRDVGRRASRNRQVISDNAKATITQLQMEKKGSKARATSRVNSAPRPNPLSLIAGIGGAALQGATYYNRYRMA